jgi:hypothetical protein
MTKVGEGGILLCCVIRTSLFPSFPSTKACITGYDYWAGYVLVSIVSTMTQGL